MNNLPATNYQHVGSLHILYDPTRLVKVGEETFSPRAWQDTGALLGGAPGRGTTVFVRDETGELALRHYRRGGLISKWVSDRYLWLGLSRSRPWREYSLLLTLHGMGLPVPRPVAARCERDGLFYRADLITERLPGVTLAAALSSSILPTMVLQAVGACIRRFHDAGVYHADLNARNILLTEEQGVALLDFDRGRLRKDDGSWRGKNLARLHRSLSKFHRQQASFAFDEGVWQTILSGYAGG
jgi:3-deoxy-D-manno-octulosonic acid kinase